MKLLKMLIPVMALFCLSSCVKTPATPPAGTGSTGTTDGSLAGFKVIPLPTVNLASLIIPNLAQFYVTNDGPYVQIQNTNQKRWHVYKYQGGSGALAWTSFKPDFTTSYFRPTTMFYEKPDVFSVYWCSTDLDPDKFGMYNINTGTTSFEDPVPEGVNGPGVFSEVIPPTKAVNSGHLWAIIGNEIWRESAVAVPRKFEKKITLPAITDRIRTDAVMADPDTETDIWIAAGNRLYQVSQVGNPAPPYGKILASWNFGSISTSDRVQAILKVSGSIIIQFGARIYRQNGSSFNLIGTLGNQSGISNICTNGSTIFASDGTYFDSNTNSWKPFIGTGQNLSGANAANYALLQSYCSGASPIGCIYGSGSGPVYILTPTDLVEIYPKL